MNRSLFGVVALAVIALTTVLIGTASAAKPPAAPTNASCPTSGTKNVLAALNVSASYDGGSYSVERFGPAAPTSLVKYCVYANVAPSALAATAVGADGSAWTASKLAKTFSFSRPGGEKTNLTLDGTKQQVGTATFGTQPTTNDIVLHISDQAQCAALYGGDSATCFVVPGEKPPTGPICDAGSGNVDAGYNAMPTDIGFACPLRATYGVEANVGTKEFGDKVTLNTTSGTDFDKMTVAFSTFACGDSGHWNTGNCVTTPGTTFTIPDTGAIVGSGGLHARIYSVNPDGTPGPLLGTAVNGDPIPYRPSADPVNCTTPGTDSDGGDDAGKWYNAAADLCHNGYQFNVTFDLSGIAVPAGGTVIWTVTFNTSNSGINPLGNTTACRVTANPGCGYDSLNVGIWTFANAEYAGTDVEDDEAWVDMGSGLTAASGYANYKPLAKITLK